MVSLLIGERMMGELCLFNTMTDTVERFTPRKTGRVKFFTCGPSVYREQHIGNYRTFLFEDVLQKYLTYSGYTVERVINFTDVEDKAIEEAREKGVSVEELRKPVEDDFFKACKWLNIDLPESIPRASTSVNAAVKLIRRLIGRGHAYWHEGDVFFDPLTCDGFGRLFGLNMHHWPKKKIRFRKDTYPGHRWNKGDFILWHKRRPKDSEQWWDTDIGQGRPAWNIQDAAMISEHLGFEIDIHAGGIDNLYRHHDYTLAIMEGASGGSFCPWWLHGGHLLVDGKKMSKSKGNVMTVEDLLGRGFLPHHIRVFLLCGPYRNKLDLSMAQVERGAGRIDRIRRLVDRLFKNLSGAAFRKPETVKDGPAMELRRAFEERMDDNLDFKGAFEAASDHLARAVQWDASRGLTTDARADLLAVLRQVDGVLGVLLPNHLGGDSKHANIQT